MTDKLTVEQRGHILCLGLNRPEKYNAMDVDMYRQLAAAYGRLQRDPELRCGVLFGHGKHFTAGLVLDEFAPIFAAGGMPAIDDDCIEPFGLNPDQRLEKPLVIAIQGISFTIGLELMLAGDIRVAADNVRFGQIEVKRGIFPVCGGTIRFIQSIGWGNAMRYLLTGDEIGADPAYRMGLIQEVTPVGQQVEKAMEIAECIARQAPLGVQATLKNARLSMVDGERAAIARLYPDLAPILDSEDAAGGVNSFIERREARFTGR